MRVEGLTTNEDGGKNTPCHNATSSVIYMNCKITIEALYIFWAIWALKYTGVFLQSSLHVLML